MQLTPDESRTRFLGARVARLATVRADGAPRIVPVVFALVGGAIVHAVDQKPKSTNDLARLRDVAAEPRVSFLVDAYDEDWSALWWARADAIATVLRPETDRGRYETIIDALAERYPQYRSNRPSGPVVSAEVIRWSGWSAS